MTKKNSTLGGKSREAEKFVIRMPDGMRDRLMSMARDKRISMNTLAVDALAAGLDLQEELMIQIEAVKLLRARLEATEVANA